MKLALFTDIHAGYSREDPAFMDTCRRFISWMHNHPAYSEADITVFLGDWFHDRSRHSFEVVGMSLDMIRKISSGREIFMILGNHDMYHRNSRTVHSLDVFADIPGVTVVDTIERFGDVVMFPYPVMDDLGVIGDLGDDCRYALGHFEFSGFRLNHVSVMEKDRIITPAMLGKMGFEHVMSGHFHKRQSSRVGGTQVTYIGNCFPHDFNDVNDFDRGFAVINTETGELDFHNWEDAPRFIRVDEDSVSDLENMGLRDGDRLEIRLSNRTHRDMMSDRIVGDILGMDGVTIRFREESRKDPEEEMVEIEEEDNIALKDQIRRLFERMETDDKIDRRILLEILDEIT